MRANRTVRLKWGILSGLLSLVIGLGDWYTGYEFSLFVFYFLPVSAAAWTIGLFGSAVIAFLCSVLWFGAQIYSGHVFPSISLAVWNMAFRFASFLIIAWSMSKLRNVLENEKDISNRLRTSIAERERVEDELRRLTAGLEQQVAKRTELAELRSKQVQALAVELIEAEEKERRQFAELLHDDLQQLLASAKMQLNAHREATQSQTLDNVERLLSESIFKTRHLAQELNPPILHNTELSAIFKWLAQRMSDRFGLKIELEMHVEKELVNPPLKRYVFRTVQELLFNVVKHSEATVARIDYRAFGDHVQVSVFDNGKGFDPAILEQSPGKPGYGLTNIRERARYVGGSLSIDTSPGKGCRFTLILPF